MRLEIQIGGRKRSVEIEREGARLRASIDGRVLAADVVSLADGTYSILIDGRAFEVRVRPGLRGLVVQAEGDEFPVEVLDPRAWRGKRSGAVEAEGRQEILAPMPGKVVRVLVNAGEAVEAGRGVVVVEAMKMQNEIRAAKTGKVERVLVREGQAVSAGEVLAVVA
jgi:biotin carboxyl carrier protein